ncbi:MAG: methyltransferase family protein [Candidatus Methylomirabilales bacterium]
MQLARHFEHTGSRFFRWRSRLPWLLLPAYAASLTDFRPWAADAWWSLACLALAAAGMGLRLHVSGTAAWGTSARNTEEPVADALNVTGLYSVVRHPLYLGNYLIGLGLCLLPRTWYLPLLFTLAFALYYERIVLVEEAFLLRRFGETFRRWADRVPGFFPRWTGYQPAALPFSWRAALRREFYGISTTAILFGIAQALKAIAATGGWRLEPVWASVVMTGGVFFVVMRTLKKRTRVLEVSGR